MQVIGAILFFICLSFLIVIFGVIVFAIYLKRKMTIFKEMEQANQAYHQEIYKNVDFYSMGQDPSASAQVVDAEYRVLPEEAEENDLDGGTP